MTDDPGARHTSAPAFEWDSDQCRITWANRAGLDFWGAPSLAALRARPFAADEDTAKVFARQLDMLNQSGVGEAWLALAPDADSLLCQVRRMPGKGGPGKGGSGTGLPGTGATHIRLEVITIADNAENDMARGIAAFEVAPAPHVVVGRDGLTLLRNDADRFAFPEVMPFVERFQDPAEARRGIRAALSGESYAHVAVVTSYGSPRTMQVVYRRFRDPATDEMAVLCTLVDAPAAGAEDRVRVAHDLRSPLNAIQGFAEYLEIAEGNLSSPERLAYLDDIQSGCTAMLTLIETLIEEDAPAASAAFFDLAAITDAVARIHAPRARRAGGDITVSIEGAEPVFGDAGATRRILDNLIDNAIRHGGARVAVNLCGTMLTVSDEGALASAPVTLSRSGSFGLENCHDLAAKMGATLRVDAAPEGGVVARLTFPKPD